MKSREGGGEGSRGKWTLLGESGRSKAPKVDGPQKCMGGQKGVKVDRLEMHGRQQGVKVDGPEI